MKQLLLWCRDHPPFVLIPIAVLTLFFAYHARHIRLDASTQAMTIATDPARVFYDQTIATFGSDNLTIVYVKDPNLFTPAMLTAVEDVFYALQDIPGVTRVDGLFNTTNFKGEDGFLSTSPLLDGVPEAAAELQQVKADALRSPLVNKVLIAPDGSALALTVTVEPDPDDPDFNVRMANDIDAAIAPLRGKVADVFQVGVPLTRRYLSTTILKDFIATSPFFYLLLFTLLIVGIRTVNGVIMPLITGGLSIVWTFGFMVLMDIPLNMLTWVIPALIFILGATEDMHILSEYRAGLEHGYDRKRAIEYMADKTGLAILLTGFTTFLGFLSITINQITILQQFGLAAAFGLLVNPLITFCLTPIYLNRFGQTAAPPSPPASTEAGGTTLMDRLANAFAHVTLHHPRGLLTVVVLSLPVVAAGIWQLKVDNDLIGYFRPHTDLRVHSQQLHRELSGMQNFFVVVDSHAENGFRKAANIRKLFDAQRYIERTPVFDASISLADHIALVNREMSNGAAEQFRIPERDDLIAQYLLFFTREDLDRYVSPDYRLANISVRHNLSSSYDLNQALRGLRAELDRLLPRSLTYTITGESILFNNAADSMAAGQAASLSLMMLSIFIVITILFVRLRAGFLALVPNAIPILYLFGVMGLMGVPLNPGTAMIAACAIGVAVDDTIHLFTRYNQEMHLHQNPEQAIVATIRADFRPVCTTSIALVVGFAILGFSSFIPMAQYGWLSAMVMLFAFGADLLVTPVLLARTKLVTLWDLLGLHLTAGVIQRAELFRDMRRTHIKKVVLLARVEDFAADAPIVTQGQVGRTMYLILQGRAKVEHAAETGERVWVRDLAEGDVFGEIALVNATDRTAHVIATVPTRVLAIDWQALERMQRMFPKVSTRLFLNLSRILGARLAHSHIHLPDAMKRMV